MVLGRLLRGNRPAPDTLSQSGEGWEMGECENCQGSLAGGDVTLPWEDGNNAYAYVVCRHCGHENTEYGFGEDD